MLTPRRWLATDPDAYFGPGGLSARQIFEKVQQGRAKEATRARQEQASDSAQPANAAALSEADLEKASSKELRSMLDGKAVDCSDCFERADLLAKARQHLLIGR